MAPQDESSSVTCVGTHEGLESRRLVAALAADEQALELPGQQRHHDENSLLK